MKGYDFNQGVDYHALLQSYKYSGFQATNFGLAVEEINKMINKRFLLLLRFDSLISRPVGKSRYQRRRGSHVPTQNLVQRYMMQYPFLLSQLSLAKCR